MLERRLSPVLDDGKTHHIYGFSTPVDFKQGKINEGAEDILKSLLEPTSQDFICLELENVNRLDSTGVNRLLILQKRCTEASSRLSLSYLSSNAKNVIKVLNLQPVFNIYRDREDYIDRAPKEY